MANGRVGIVRSSAGTLLQSEDLRFDLYTFFSCFSRIFHCPRFIVIYQIDPMVLHRSEIVGGSGVVVIVRGAIPPLLQTLHTTAFDCGSVVGLFTSDKRNL